MIDEYLNNIKTEIINGNAKVAAKNYYKLIIFK